MKLRQRVTTFFLACSMVLSASTTMIPALTVHAANGFSGALTSVESVIVDENNKNIVYVTFNDNVQGKITFLENGIFRYNVDPSGQFSKYATPRSESHAARIQQYPDESDKYSKPDVTVTTSGDLYKILK